MSGARAFTALLSCVALGSCAAPTSYMGISFAPGAAAGDLQELARRAQAGDKQAQLDLGIAYEEGRGVAVDLKRAVGLYRIAAMNSGGSKVVSIPTQSGVTTTIVNTGKQKNGLTAALSRQRAIQRFMSETESISKYRNFIFENECTVTGNFVLIESHEGISKSETIFVYSGAVTSVIKTSKCLMYPGNIVTFTHYDNVDHYDTSQIEISDHTKYFILSRLNSKLTLIGTIRGR